MNMPDDPFDLVFNDPNDKLAESIRDMDLAEIERLRARVVRLETALRQFIDDTEDRWDMNSPSTNPGIKHCVEQGRNALKESYD